MFTGQAMKTMVKFVLLCSHFDSVFLKHFVAFFFAILPWHSGCAVMPVGSPSALWDCGSLPCSLWLVCQELLGDQVIFVLNLKAKDACKSSVVVG